MDYPTQSHLTVIREQLTYRLRELQAEVRADELALRQGEPGPGEVSDRKDSAALLQRLQVDTAQERRDLDEMAEVIAALKRLDEGRYGDCVDCGEPIRLWRLMAWPAATRCASCQALREQARR